MPPVRVLHEVGVMDRGGTETWLLQVLRRIDRERFRFDFLVRDDRPGAYDDEVRSLGSAVIPCASPSRPLAYASALDRILARSSYDIVHGHLYLFSALALWRAARHRVPARIAHLYPVSDTRPQTPLRRLYRAGASRLMARSATLLAACSESTLAATRRMPALRSVPARVVPLGIDLAPFARRIDRGSARLRLGLPPAGSLVTYVARFVAHKDHALALRVADRLALAGVRAHFVFAGSHGDRLPALREAAASRTDLSLLVGLDDVTELLLASDVFLFPSREEGFGMVALEAAAAGLPVVASALPALREMLPASHQALMFAPGDDAAATASLLRVLGDDALTRGLSVDARSFADGFDIDRSVASLTGLYLAALSFPPA